MILAFWENKKPQLTSFENDVSCGFSSDSTFGILYCRLNDQANFRMNGYMVYLQLPND